jgi:hypothetical protein
MSKKRQRRKSIGCCLFGVTDEDGGANAERRSFFMLFAYALDEFMDGEHMPVFGFEADE